MFRNKICGLIFLSLLTIVNMDVQAQSSDTLNKNSLRFVPPGPKAKSSEIIPVFIPLKDGDSDHATNKPNDDFKSSGKSGVVAYSNIEQNSQSNYSTKSFEYIEKWKTEVNNDHPPQNILVTENRILVEAFFWQMFNQDGSLVKVGKSGMSHLMIDEKLQKFFFVNANGELVAYNLKDGSLYFATLVQGGDEYIRPLMMLQNNRMIITGIERQLDPHMHYKASKSTFMQIDLSNVLKENYNPRTDYAANTGVLYFPMRELAAAAYGNNIVIAYPGAILILDSTSKILNAYSGAFNPLAVSTDEEANIYLLVETAKGKFVWKINSKGEKLFSIKTDDARLYPPIIGFDGRVYVPTEKNILVFDKLGNQEKQVEVKNKFSYAVVTRDHKLLIADGSQLILSDDSKDLKIIFDTGKDEFCTAPVITNSGEIVVATKQYLYCLTAK